MFYTIADDLIFYQVLAFKKIYSNFELKLREYFFEKTEGIYPVFVIVIRQIIFFFVKNHDYFCSNSYIDSMRRELGIRKIIIIRIEKTLINMLFNFFPDLNIENIKVEFDNKSGKREISIYFLFFNERGIAIGRDGEYIRAVNEIFDKYIIFENKSTPLKVKCKFKQQH